MCRGGSSGVREEQTVLKTGVGGGELRNRMYGLQSKGGSFLFFFCCIRPEEEESESEASLLSSASPPSSPVRVPSISSHPPSIYFSAFFRLARLAVGTPSVMPRLEKSRLSVLPRPPFKPAFLHIWVFLLEATLKSNRIQPRCWRIFSRFRKNQGLWFRSRDDGNKKNKKRKHCFNSLSWSFSFIEQLEAASIIMKMC